MSILVKINHLKPCNPPLTTASIFFPHKTSYQGDTTRKTFISDIAVLKKKERWKKRCPVTGQHSKNVLPKIGAIMFTQKVRSVFGAVLTEATVWPTLQIWSVDRSIPPACLSHARQFSSLFFFFSFFLSFFSLARTKRFTGLSVKSKVIRMHENQHLYSLRCVLFHLPRVES